MSIQHFTFLNSNQQQSFHEKGYVVISLLDENKVQALLNIYQEVQVHLQKKGVNIYTTGEHIEKEVAIKTNKVIQELVKNPVNSIIEDFDTLMAAFIVKSPEQNVDDYFDWHQDLSFVDESKYESAQVWIALQDTNIGNGSIQVVDKSHQFNNFIRTAPKFPSFFKNFEKNLVNQAKNIALKAGEAVIFNHRVWHSSPANTSKNERLAILMSIKVPKANWLYYYHSENEDLVKTYKADLDFYLKVWIDKQIDETKLNTTFPYTFPQMTQKDFEKIEKKKSILDKLKTMF